MKYINCAVWSVKSGIGQKVSFYEKQTVKLGLFKEIVSKFGFI